MSTALYRRYRPESFSEVIGQEHVTDPLRSALRDGRVGHAYLFSGPRGCGKTTSARILARCLNCAQGPTDTPCGVCDSCVELARGGSGSLDVVEIDAASHGGVEDARELRDRATFATARDRFKIFIIDEAHMVSPQGFNALLKIVEEPPPHVKFVFATTEPDKVLATIRSRTHHYPFRLVPPEVLQRYLGEVCASEGVEAGTGVLPLVVRAGAGSVRDSLSVLDQLAAGAGDGGIDYERAIDLLGYTPQSLLDDVVSALAVGDGGAVFRIVDRVVQSGQDPRRFVDDLLQRLRDLIIVEAVGEAAASVFPGCPADQLHRMTQQAGVYGAAPLSRAADLANAASSEMTGATSPRLHLELLAARMLLPAADDAERGLAARLDRMERRLSVPGSGPVSPGAGALSDQHGRAQVSAPAPAPEAPEAPDASAPPAPPAQASAAPSPPREAPSSGATSPPAAPEPPPEADPSVTDARSAPETPTDPSSTPDAGQEATTPGTDDGPAEEETARSAPAAEDVLAVDGACQAAAASGGSDAIGPGDPGSGSSAESTEAVRRMWPDVLEELARTSRRTWTRVSHDAAVLRVDETSVVLQLRQPGLLLAFSQGAHADNVRAALMTVLGLDRRVVAVGEGDEPPGSGTGSSTGPAGAAEGGAGPAGGRPGVAPSGGPGQAAQAPSGGGAATTTTAPRPAAPAAPPVPAGFVAGWDGPAPSDDDVPPDEDSIPPEGMAAAGSGTVRRSKMLREQVASAAATGPSGPGAAGGEHGAGASARDDEPSRDDVDAEDSGLVGAALVAQRLGGRVIEDGGR